MNNRQRDFGIFYNKVITFRPLRSDEVVTYIFVIVLFLQQTNHIPASEVRRGRDVHFCYSFVFTTN
jgi:hypothetical protein